MHIPKTQPLYLALDQGGHASRALVFDKEGCIVAQAYQKIKTQSPQPGWVEHDAETLVASLQSAMRDVVKQLGKEQRGLCAAGLATQRSSIVCWHRTTKQALSKVISWQDRRNADWMHTFAAETTAIHEITGLFPSAHYGASKLRWCLDHLPEVQRAQAQDSLCFGPLASFLSARLTQANKAWVDPANAARTLLWNIKTGDWDAQLLKKFAIPLQALPTCVDSRYNFGRIALSRLEIPLSVVTGDQTAALFQEGSPRKNVIYINIGTGAFLQGFMENTAPEAPRLLSSVIFSEHKLRQYALEGTVNGAGAALSWFAKQYDSVAWPEQSEIWLRDTLNPPLFINGIGGIGSPFWQPKIDSHFIGKGDQGARFCALVESILFLIQTNLDEMLKILGPPKTLILSGGLSASDHFCQKLADLSEIPVVRSAQQEATARGLANLLAQSYETRDDGASQRLAPQPALKLQGRYGQWLKKMHTLTD